MESGNNPFLPDGRQWAWNSSSLNPAKTCSRKYYYEVICGYVTKDENVHLTFGGIYASALEQYHDHKAAWGNHQNAMVAAVGYALHKSWGKLSAAECADLPGAARYKTRENLIRSIVWYLDEYEDDPCETVILSDGKPAVELTFKFKYSKEIWFVGHLDRLVRYGGDYYVQDQKTTGSSIGPWYFKRYNPDNQMSLYTAAGEVCFNTPVKGVMIDAAQIAMGFTRFERGFSFRTEDQIEEWLRDAKYHIELTWAAAERDWPMNDSSCVSGDSIVSVTRGSRKGWKMSISHLYDLMKKDIKWPKKQLDTYVLSEVDGYTKNNLVLDVLKQGVKTVFEIKTADSQSLKATADHKINTPYGWRRVDELNEGDILLFWRSGNRLPKDQRKKPQQRATLSSLYYYPHGHMPESKSVGIRKRRLGATQRISRLKAEADQNGLSFEEFIWILRNDSYRATKLIYLPSYIEVHHKDNDASNDDITNLEVTTVQDHKEQHRDISTKLSQTVITSIEQVGEELVFDLAMKAPYHNFIANGLVAHNCDKYGGCVFRDVCSKSPSVRQDYLDGGGFVKRFRNPLGER